MTALKREAIQLLEQMPEEQMPYVIQYIQTLNNRVLDTRRFSDRDEAMTPKMRAFVELEKMLVPISEEIDYDKELAEAREEKYGSID